MIYAGWNVEILFLAAVGGLTVLKGLPDKDQRILGVPNRRILPLFWAVGAVFVEVSPLDRTLPQGEIEAQDSPLISS